MSNNIQIHRSAGNSAPSGLLAGELAWSDNNATPGNGGAAGFLYIGDMSTGTAVNRKIGGPGWGLELLTDSILTGNPTAPTVTQLDNSTSVATTAYVDLAVANAEPAMNDISDVNITGLSDADFLIWNASTAKWENKPVGGHLSMLNTGVFTVTDVGNDAVDLGSQTTGSYVASVSAGDNISIGGTTGEGAAVTVALSSDVTIAGNLTVNGATTTVVSDTVSVADPIFVLGSDTNDSKDRGISFKWNDGTSREGYFGYDESADAFTIIPQTTSMAGEVAAGNVGNAIFADITGELQTAAQPNITGLGTITSGAWQSTTKIAPAYGGTGEDSSSSSGVAVVSTGNWTFESSLDVSLGGTGNTTVATDSILLGRGAGDMHALVPGAEGSHLRIESGSPVWSQTINGGTW